MLENSRRRVLALIGTAAGLPLLPPLKVLAASPSCYASQDFPPWKAQATQAQAGARMDEVSVVDPDACDLRIEVQIGSTFEGKFIIYGDPDKTPLPKPFLIKPDNRVLLRTADGKTVVDEQLCGTCTDIHDDKVTVILPLACAPYFRSENQVEMAVKLANAEECRFKLDCETLRKALAWASDRRDELAEKYADQGCTPPPGCFITTACCETLGLADDCFELRTLRLYRDRVLARTEQGRQAIALYYEIAPAILRALPEKDRHRQLVWTYARYVWPAAVAAKLRFNKTAYRLYASMMRKLGHGRTTALQRSPRFAAIRSRWRPSRLLRSAHAVAAGLFRNGA